MLGVISVVGAVAHVPVLGGVALVLLLVITPWAQPLAVRVMVWMVVVLALAGVAVRLAPVTWGALPTTALVLCLLLAHVVVAFRWRPDAPLAPTLPLPDGLVLMVGVAAVLMLGIPYIGASADEVMLDLARGYDTVNHFTVVANMLAEGGLGQDSGSYPVGVHAAIAGAAHLSGVGGARDIIHPFAWSLVLATGASATVLGWIAVRVAESAGPEEASHSRSSLAALGFGAVVLLGGSLAAPFELGHAVFVVAATAGVAASWLALSPSWHTSPMPLRVGILLIGGVALLGAYPPLLVGLGPAGLVVLLHTWASRERRGDVLGVAGVGLAIAGAFLLWVWRGQIEHLLVATGEHSTPLFISAVLVVLTAGMAWTAREHACGRLATIAMAPASGYLAGALVLALGAAAMGKVPGESYYAAKVGEAAWLATLPVLIGLAASGIVAATEGIPSWRRTPERVIAVFAVGLMLALLPIGRQPISLAGTAILAQRLLEADRVGGRST